MTTIILRLYRNLMQWVHEWQCQCNEFMSDGVNGIRDVFVLSHWSSCVQSYFLQHPYSDWTHTLPLPDHLKYNLIFGHASIEQCWIRLHYQWYFILPYLTDFRKWMTTAHWKQLSPWSEDHVDCVLIIWSIDDCSHSFKEMSQSRLDSSSLFVTLHLHTGRCGWVVDRRTKYLRSGVRVPAKRHR